MLTMFKRFIKEEDGLGTVEIVIIIAVLVGIALIFRSTIIDFVKGMLTKIFSDDKIKDAGNVDLGTISTD
ncbi:putative flagellin with Flp1-like domain [Anaerobacterium chartisolvens]|uniref:Putative flagellin with Flp1-like domain n=1 Tax=Anaerobacterium chartisolvens TaxID=1297424 RepID=A0A369AJP5_9FIRM|nr:Flp1 family type IVb pilin [Anaerobacterium chartisolvens]RCX09602.1 putative flagellin with Flp1-like domain [Anaerobacterium chartisolvens]